MACEVQYGLAFKEDLDAHMGYLMQGPGGAQAADKLLADLEEAQGRVAEFPRMYAVARLPQWAACGYRVQPVGAYRAVYSVKQGKVHYLRLFHKAQDSSAVFIHAAEPV